MIYFQTKAYNIELMFLYTQRVECYKFLMIQTVYILTCNMVLKLKSFCKHFPILFSTSLLKMVIFIYQCIFYQLSTVGHLVSIFFHYLRHCSVNVLKKNCLYTPAVIFFRIFNSQIHVLKIYTYFSEFLSWHSG